VVTYKDKFKGSIDKAHYKNVATKILRDMDSLRSSVGNSKSVARRWVWELIQNAKDVQNNGEVNINIEFDLTPGKEKIIFSHTGRPFTADNIRFLIEQVSSKDREKDENGKRKTSGKFGTGFLSTHLLSEKVKVKAIAKEPELDYRKFELDLDRSGNDPEEITKAIEEAEKSIENLDKLPVFTNYFEGEFNTYFYFDLEDNLSRRVAEEGLKDLEKCIPFSLTFLDELGAINIFPSNLKYSVDNSVEILSENIKLTSISIGVNQLKIVTINKNFTTIALPVSISQNGIITILPFESGIPKLFCDFPLVGTESFSFPVIINNPNFNPTDPRDGIFLAHSERINPKVEENIEIIKEGIELYFELLEFAAENNWKEIHLLAQIHPLKESLYWVSNEWFNLNILKPIRSKLLKVKIVNPANDSIPVAVLNEEDEKYMWFPYSPKKSVRDKIWQLANDWFPWCLPREEDVETWYKLVWQDCGLLTTKKFAEFVEYLKTVEVLAEKVGDKNVFQWLNQFYELLKLDTEEYDWIINNKSIFPNQNGILCKKEHLRQDSGDIEDEFKDILTLLGNDIRDELVASEITLSLSAGETRNQEYVVKEISSIVNRKTNEQEQDSNTKEAFKNLLIWFRENPDNSKHLFPDLFRRKHILYDDEEIADNMEKAEQLNLLLAEYNIVNPAQLKTLIEKGQNQNSLLPITESILASMGITSIDDWNEAIKDQDLAALFAHNSTPDADLFVYVHTLIAEAKQKVVSHLETLEGYDITEWEEIAPTTLAGIKKEGREIYVVVRPAYNGQVIIYYGSEQNTLDYENAELWIDDGMAPKRITMGHILKKANIRKFPI
jgi:hypothetical protein